MPRKKQKVNDGSQPSEDPVNVRRTRSSKNSSIDAQNFVSSQTARKNTAPKAKIPLKEPKVVLSKVDAAFGKTKLPKVKSAPKLKELGNDDIKRSKIMPDCSNAICSSDCHESSSESEWEEVEEQKEKDLDDYNPIIPTEGVEITIDCPELNVRKRKKKQFDEMDWVRLHINRKRKEIQLNIHKTHILCLLGHGMYLNNILNSPELRALALSLVPDDIASFACGKKANKFDCNGIKKLVEWFKSSFSFQSGHEPPFKNSPDMLLSSFETLVAPSASEYNLVFLVIARTLGLKSRLCLSLYPVSHKAKNLISKKGCTSSANSESEPTAKKSKKSESSKASATEAKQKTAKNTKSKRQKPISQSVSQPNGSEVENKKLSRPKRSTNKSYKLSSDDDDDFTMETSEDENEKTSKCPVKKTRKTASNRKILSSESESRSPIPRASIFDTEQIVCWLEIFSKPDKQWIPVECVNNIINLPYAIEEKLRKPVVYILAYDNDSFVKDVTKRYCNDFLVSTLKLRVDKDWWDETIEPFSPPSSKLDKEEEKKLDDVLINQPLPTTVSAFKNHPLYALKRHLLKFEGIYPPDAQTVGFFRKEPVYPRDCVQQLHSRETWLKEARVVRLGEEPYKIVKARPKWDKMAGVFRTDLPLDLFGFWQTIPYEPPVAKDGKVPRNEYGNVELFKPCMLPKGTVHLQMAGVARIAKKLGIDCSPAVVGFDGHKGSVHPVYDGFVICEEFKDTILVAWDEEQENIRKREEERRDKRIYGNWRKLIKGLLIKERIKAKHEK